METTTRSNPTRLRIPSLTLIAMGGLSAVAGTVILSLHLIKGYPTEVTIKVPGTDQEFTDVPVLPILTAPMYCGVLFVVMGTIGACAKAPACTRVIYLIFAILGAIILAPAQILASAIFVLAYLAGMLEMQDPNLVGIWVLFALTAFFGVIEFFVSIVAAIISACCLKGESRDQSYAMVPSKA